MLSPKNMGEISYFTPQNEGKVGSHGWGILEIKYNPFSSKISLVETLKAPKQTYLFGWKMNVLF